MKYLIPLIIILLISCNYSQREVFLYEKSENWGEWHAGDSTSIQYKLKVYRKGNNLIYYTTNFYPNGVEKCKTIHIGDKLEKILFVNDTSGHSLDFGKLENGNGHVKVYDFNGTLESSGNYINGNREGWWMIYNFAGPIMDSTLYEDGFDISTPHYPVLEELMGDKDNIRNNFYN